MGRVTNPALMLIPHDALGALLTLFLMLGGLCLMVGWWRAATTLIVTAISVPFISLGVELLFNEFFAQLPGHLVRPVAWLVLGVAYLLVAGAVMGLVFGEKVWSETKAHLLADALRWLFRLVFSPLMLGVWAALGLYLWWHMS